MLNSSTSVDTASQIKLIDKAKFFLTQGNLIAFNTDTVPGVAALCGYKKARQKIFTLKKRPTNKPLVWMFDDLIRVKKYFYLTTEGKKILHHYWPGAITFILQLKTEKSDKEKDQGVGVRIPNDGFIRELIRNLAKPLYVTSANLSGEKDLRQMEEIKTAFGEKISYYINQKVNTRTEFFGNPSTVVDIRKKPYKVLRQGRVEFVP